MKLIVGLVAMAQIVRYVQYAGLVLEHSTERYLLDDSREVRVMTALMQGSEATGFDRVYSQRERGFYLPSQAARIARVPRRLLRAWHRGGLVQPILYVVDEEGVSHTGYDFDSLLYLRLLRSLREHGITLERAARALKHLVDRFGPPSSRWADARIFADGRDVYVQDADEWGTTVASIGGQRIAEELFGEDFARMRERLDAVLVPSEFLSSVTIDPAIRSGQPVVRGTTLPTSVLYNLHKRGLSPSQILGYYPSLTEDQIQRAVAYEAELDAEAA